MTYANGYMPTGLRPEAADLADNARVITGRPITIGAALAIAREVLMPLLVGAFESSSIPSHHLEQSRMIPLDHVIKFRSEYFTTLSRTGTSSV